MSEWLPIESAPRDDTVFDVWVEQKNLSHISGYRHPNVFYDKHGRLSFVSSTRNLDVETTHKMPEFHQIATHWMPIPTPPIPKEGQ